MEPFNRWSQSGAHTTSTQGTQQQRRRTHQVPPSATNGISSGSRIRPLLISARRPSRILFDFPGILDNSDSEDL